MSNVADTDFSLPANQRWAEAITTKWQGRAVPDVLPVIGGQAVTSDRWAEGRDPSNPGEAAYRWARADRDQVDAAISGAVEASVKWAAVSTEERRRILDRCAEELARRRGDLIGAMMLDAGKAIAEADVEVSEAVDFALYYGRSLDEIQADGSAMEPIGVVTVASPWNFPLAIPAGGVLAALAAGNSVLFKPASETVLIGSMIADALWDAGVPKDVLQFVPTAPDTGRTLIEDSRVGSVILTGAWETGKMFLGWRPDLRLNAETSGKERPHRLRHGGLGTRPSVTSSGQRSGTTARSAPPPVSASSRPRCMTIHSSFASGRCRSLARTSGHRGISSRR